MWTSTRCLPTCRRSRCPTARALVWFEDGRVVVPARWTPIGGPNVLDPRQIDLPVLKTQRLLQERFGAAFHHDPRDQLRQPGEVTMRIALWALAFGIVFSGSAIGGESTPAKAPPGAQMLQDADPPPDTVIPDAKPREFSPEEQKQLDEVARLDLQLFRLWKDRKYREALPLAEKALAIRRKVVGDDHLDTAESLGNVAAQLLRLA